MARRIIHAPPKPTAADLPQWMVKGDKYLASEVCRLFRRMLDCTDKEAQAHFQAALAAGTIRQNGLVGMYPGISVYSKS